MKTIIKISFKNLKQNYLEVQQLLEEKSGEKNICIKSKIANDLSLVGDDNYYLLDSFITKYNLDFSNFNYAEHFESEGELTMSIWSILSVFFIPLFILKGILSYVIYLYSKKYSDKIDSFNFFLREYKSDRIDLTMGDLITSKIKGKFLLRENVKFVFD
ncbi:DUF1493 family protein [Flavobacterium nackdongense]|uniref:DUF1493 family protein n=1 Tax=Flavobacterium nackdongense TaxID=2547394 RepID=A0A4P6YAU9_9FLAO|nr:DUF1493 family protein [Flavobacterium nackdongense]QBN17775.1 DUF1493 family protein [Flavobacterium nackdongense]